MDTEKNIKYIDIEEVIRKKSPRLFNILPRFLISYLKRVIHQDEINHFLKKHGHLEGYAFLNEALKFLGVRIRSKGMENIPQGGRFIFVSNHPLGGLDGLVFIHEIGKIYPQLRFPVNDILLNIQNFREFFIPINKHGKQSQEGFAQMEQAYNSDQQILYFPAGLCSRKIKGEIIDLEWHKSFIAKAIKHERDIIPVYFKGKNSSFFYRLANIRKFMGIKANIEMLYLADEMFKQKNREIVLTVGKPIPYTYFTKKHSYRMWAAKVKEHVYALGKGKALSNKV